MARLQARKERLAAACSSSDKASIPDKRERWATVRQRHATRPSGGVSSEKPAPRQPLIAHRARQLPPLAEKLNKPARQVSPASSVMTGSSFSYIAPHVVAQATSSPRPLTPNAPRATSFRNVNCAPVPFAIPVKSSKAMETPEKPAKRMDFVHPDPARTMGNLYGFPGPNGQDSFIHGSEPAFQHAECGSPDCNKKGLHQFSKRYAIWKFTGNPRLDLPYGEQIATFSAADKRRQLRDITYKELAQDIWFDAGRE
ncbi:MAG: hypothetical protein LQ339_002767 [Xanthoria mediterranea]|nr:MAG: hypothetical protein LQ339_002767 [Xanthoria mediterranea]